MCWIFAYTGKSTSVDTLVTGLKNLEYRGYDSAWIFWITQERNTVYERATGKVANLAKKVQEINPDHIISWIAHTRWATHGKVTEANCHPHHSKNDRFFIVHNGIIENFQELKRKLIEKGYTFYSDTDTEIVAKLIEDEFEISLKITLEKIVKKLVWAYAFAVIDREHPEEVVWVRLWSPLIVGEGENASYISSDINALSTVADSYTILDDYETVILKNGKVQIFASGKEIQKKYEEIDKKAAEEWIGNFPTYTEKEIFDIPQVIENVFSGRVDFESKTIKNETLQELQNHDIEKIEIIASGTSYYAWYIGSYYLKELGNIPTNISISSEFLSDTFFPDKKTLYVFLSQSGETADVRESLKIVKEQGCLTFGIVNVVWSTIARLTDMGLYSHAGVEIWVASTKNAIAQIAIMLMMALALGQKRGLQHNISRSIIEDIEGLWNKINKVLMNTHKIKEVAQKYTQFKSLFYLGRNILYPTSGEASLKCKELSYIHSESYSAWELKHGPLALVWEDFPCIFLNPKSKFYHKTISNIQEVKARKWNILGVISETDREREYYTNIIEVPETSEYLSPFVILPAMYLFAYHISQELGREIDKPRNLAKSVTVE